MDQIESLIAKIKPGHVIIHMSFQLNIDDDFNLLSTEMITKELMIDSDEMKQFLDSCVGEYTFNNDEYTISFNDNRDYVRYLLTLEDKNTS